MAKELVEVRLLIFGDGDGANTARFEYIVGHSDDPDLVKHSSLDVTAPMFSLDTIDEFFDGYVATIKSNEGIV